MSWTRIHARKVYDGEGSELTESPVVLVRDGMIQAVGEEALRTDLPAGEVEELDLKHLCLLPGFVDVHVHLIFGTGARTYEDVVQADSDLIMAIRGVRNCADHLRAGVTTVRDCGGRNFITLALRDGERQGLFVGPRILASGPPITRTGGHFWWCGGEADGVEGVRRQARRLVKNGVDFFKIMATGGGTVGTDSRYSAYTSEEIAAAVQEAHQVGLLTTAHAIAASGIRAAIDGGIDQIEHLSFVQLDGQYRFDSELADRVIERGIFVSPTIQTSYRGLEELNARTDLSSPERAEQASLQKKLEAKLEFVGRFRDLGANIVAGTDAIQSFGDYALGLELLFESGLTAAEVLNAATVGAARAIGVDRETGSLRAGKVADIVAVEGDPFADIKAFERVRFVMRAGSVFRNDAPSETADHVDR